MSYKHRLRNIQNNKTQRFRYGRNAGAAGIAFLLAFLFAFVTLIPCTVLAEESDDTEAIDPFSRDTGFHAVLYDNTNGLPTSEANDIAETSDGFIWIGSYSGLVRYDGNDFVRYSDSTGISNVNTLFVDSKGRLWVGTNDNGVALLEKGSFRIWNQDNGLKSASVRSIVEDDKGVIYVATTRGIAILSPDLELSTVNDPQLRSVFIDYLHLGKDNLVYGLTNTGDVFTMKDGSIIDYVDHDKSHFSVISCVYPDPNAPGYVYLDTEDLSVCRCRLGADAGEAETIDISPLSQVQRFEEIDGRLWICARNGIGVLDGLGLAGEKLHTVNECVYLDSLPRQIDFAAEMIVRTVNLSSTL